MDELTQTPWTYRALRWAAAGLVAALVLALWWGGAQPVAVGLVPAPWDKLLHLAVFGVLAAAVRVCVARPGALGWWVAFGVALAVGVGDEWHQLGLVGRSAGWGDLGADALGAAVGALVGAAALTPDLSHKEREEDTSVLSQRERE